MELLLPYNVSESFSMEIFKVKQNKWNIYICFVCMRIIVIVYL